MYYLEDQHPRYEYTCYCQVGNAEPYIGIWNGTKIEDVYRHIAEIEKRHQKYHQRFYIDNDFYNNHYTYGDYVYYYKFMKRTVNDWQELTENAERFKLVS